MKTHPPCNAPTGFAPVAVVPPVVVVVPGAQNRPRAHFGIGARRWKHPKLRVARAHVLQKRPIAWAAQSGLPPLLGVLGVPRHTPVSGGAQPVVVAVALLAGRDAERKAEQDAKGRKVSSAGTTNLGSVEQQKNRSL